MCGESIEEADEYARDELEGWWSGWLWRYGDIAKIMRFGEVEIMIYD